jgi:peptidoglycan hydrolase-like protein with peptidoglycan-binding domain
MKKRTLKEELERIHAITYGKGYLIEDDMLNAMVQNEPADTTKPTIDDPDKADYVTSDVTKFFNDLDAISEPVTQQKSGSMEHQKEVELSQMALVLLGYELPRHGVDGLFGPETAEAVKKYKQDNSIINESFIPGIDEMVWNKMPWGIDAGSKQVGIKWSGHNTHIHFGFTSAEVAVKVIEKAKELGLHAGENPYTSKVNPVHVSDSHHYETFNQTINGKKVGAGLDVSGDSKKMEELFNWVSTTLGNGDSVSMDTTHVDGDDNTAMEIITPEMIDSMVSKLELKGVTEEELKKLIDEVKSGGSADFTDLDLMTDEGYSKYSEICDKFIKTRQPNLLEINGGMMAGSAKRAFEKYHKYVPPELALAQLATEGGIGNSDPNSRPIRTKNPFNVGNTDDGSNIDMGAVQEGINAYYNLIARSYLGKGKSAKDLVQDFVNHDGNHYATAGTYEKVVNQIARQANRIAQTVV